MRLFFAAWPPEPAAAALHEWALQVQADTGGRVTAPENIHLTLAFLGEAEPARAKAAAATVRAARHALPIDEARYVKRNEMVWAGPRAMPPELRQLVAALQGSLAAAGFVLEDRPFAAHVTLIRKARAPRALPPLPAIAWPVGELLLVRSRTSPRGATYEPVQRFPLPE